MADLFGCQVTPAGQRRKLEAVGGGEVGVGSVLAAMPGGVLASAVEQFGAERFPEPILLDDAAWVSYRFAEILPIEVSLKQQLLEIPAEKRLEILHALLVQAGAQPPS